MQVALNSERFTDVRTTEKVLVKRAAPSGVMSEEVVCSILTTNTAKRGRGTAQPRHVMAEACSSRLETQAAPHCAMPAARHSPAT